jgi:flavin reductase (DIM6/NTAB) family NADH-FMN oxidoreductase RutF
MACAMREVCDPVDAQAFRLAMRRLAGGVSVVTVGALGARSGFTATSVVSLSVAPAVLMVSVNAASSSWPLMREQGRFGVNVLGEHQQRVAERFSGRDGIQAEDRYARSTWHRVEDAWLLDGATAAFACEIEECFERHGHCVVLGRVRAMRTAAPDDGALVYWKTGYTPLMAGAALAPFPTPPTEIRTHGTCHS